MKHPIKDTHKDTYKKQYPDKKRGYKWVSYEKNKIFTSLLFHTN